MLDLSVLLKKDDFLPLTALTVLIILRELCKDPIERGLILKELYCHTQIGATEIPGRIVIKGKCPVSNVI